MLGSQLSQLTLSLLCACFPMLLRVAPVLVGGSGHLSAGTARESIQGWHLCGDVAKGVRWHSSGTLKHITVDFIEPAHFSSPVSDRRLIVT